MVERTKIYDSLYLKYGLKLNYLMKAYDYHDLANDSEIKETEQSYRMQLDKNMKDQGEEFIKKIELSEAENQTVT